MDSYFRVLVNLSFRLAVRSETDTGGSGAFPEQLFMPSLSKSGDKQRFN